MPKGEQHQSNGMTDTTGMDGGAGLHEADGRLHDQVDVGAVFSDFRMPTSSQLRS